MAQKLLSIKQKLVKLPDSFICLLIRRIESLSAVLGLKR